MARHFKNGLEYFSHDTNMKEDTKIKLLKAKYKLTGYAVYNLLLEDIYKDSYLLKLDEDYILLFATENNIDEKELRKIIDYMIEKKLFDKDLFVKYKILTSKRIQQNYLRGCTRRKNVSLIKEILLVNPDELLNDTEKKATVIIYANINTLSLCVNDNISTQSKVKETETQSKQESKVKETESNLPEKAPAFNLQNELKNIFESHYFQLKKTAYYYDGKDAGALKQLINKIRSVCTADKKTDQDVINGFKYILNSLNDEWVKDNLDIPLINSKFNSIISKIKNGQNTNSNGTGSKGFDLRKNSWIESTLKNALLITGKNSD